MAEDHHELYCILLPLSKRKLLLPRSLVQEVRGLSKVEPLAGSPAWLRGFVPWQGEQIPLIAIEPLLGADLPEVSRRSRMVMVRVPEVALTPPVVAIHAQGFPYILRITPALVGVSEIAEYEHILAEVTLGFERPLIPDIPGLAAATARLLPAA